MKTMPPAGLCIAKLGDPFHFTGVLTAKLPANHFPNLG